MRVCVVLRFCVGCVKWLWLDGGKEKKVESDDDGDKEGPAHPDNKFEKGDYIEALDTIKRWETANVIKVNGLRIKIHFDQWSSR